LGTIGAYPILGYREQLLYWVIGVAMSVRNDGERPEYEYLQEKGGQEDYHRYSTCRRVLLHTNA